MKKTGGLKSIFIDDSQKKFTAQIISAVKNDDLITDHLPEITNYKDGKKHLAILPSKGELLGICASLSEEYICCGTHVLRTISNCPFDCSYCFLQNYLTHPYMYSIGNIDAVVDEIKKTIQDQPWRFFRIGTWELGDSLAIEHLTRQAEQLILSFKDIPNALLELKTKCNCVNSILKLPHDHRTVISWSLNPDSVIEQDESGTARLNERLTAMKKIVDHGYLTALHFDPMIYHDNWQLHYEDLISKIFSQIPGDRIAWISIGSLRFNPEMKQKMEMNFPSSKLTSAEMVLGNDHKIRYVKPIRIEMYKTMVQLLKKYNNFQIFTYLCMERPDMWDKIFGYHPKSNNHQNYLFTKSLYERFPGMVPEKPDLEKYLQN